MYEGHWILKDGYASASLNGTWVYLSKETPITDKMTFKASEILFEASLTNNWETQDAQWLGGVSQGVSEKFWLSN